MTNNEKIWIFADEVKLNLKKLSDLIGCHAINISDGKIEFHCSRLEDICGELFIIERNSEEYPHEYYKLIDGVKFFKVGK